ncbi:Protein W09G3.7 a [Aphelenchoides avenae]|nr:Protein W09G3.7 a [Aphelenchus avenae]
MRLSWLNAKKIRRVAAGCGFSLFASSNELYGCGLNNFYQLGGPYRTETHKRSEEWYHKGRRIMFPEEAGKIVSISAGRMHSLIATTTGLYSFGDNAHGQCGHHPDQMPTVAHGRRMTLPRVDIPTHSPIKKVHCSLDTSFVLLENGELYSFGLGTDGQLGNSTEEIRWRPRRIDGEISGEKIVDISGSTDTIVAVSKAGDLFVWGQNEYRQLGLVTDEPQVFVPVRFPVNLGRVVSAAATGSSCIACNEEGLVYVWGSEVLGLGPNVTSTDRPIQLDAPLFASAVGEESRVTRVFAGNVIMGARTEPGHLFTWGSNRHGGLALGHENDQLFPYQVSLPGAIKEAAFGPDHTLLLSR